MLRPCCTGRSRCRRWLRQISLSVRVPNTPRSWPQAARCCVPMLQTCAAPATHGFAHACPFLPASPHIAQVDPADLRQCGEMLPNSLSPPQHAVVAAVFAVRAREIGTGRVHGGRREGEQEWSPLPAARFACCYPSCTQLLPQALVASHQRCVFVTLLPFLQGTENYTCMCGQLAWRSWGGTAGWCMQVSQPLWRKAASWPVPQAHVRAVSTRFGCHRCAMPER
jgi:hypothetical protein